MTDTASMIENIADLQLKMMRGTGLDRRGQHPKQHGCVKAEFTVRDDIPDQYKVGLFKTSATYETHIRFSNAKWHNDVKGDVHGMAIKLTGVSGERTLESEI